MKLLNKAEVTKLVTRWDNEHEWAFHPPSDSWRGRDFDIIQDFLEFIRNKGYGITYTIEVRREK